MKTLRLFCVLLLTVLFCSPAWAYYAPSIGRFINRDPIEEKGGLNQYAYVLNQPVNAIDYLGMDIIFGVRVGSTVTDPGHVLVGVTAGDRVRIFDWQATGGAGNVISGLGRTDASVDATALSIGGARNLNEFIKSRGNYTFYRLSTSNAEDVLALAKAYELRDMANASEDDSFYNIVMRHCGDTSCEVIRASENRAPAIGNARTPAQYQRAAEWLSQPGRSGWIRITPQPRPEQPQEMGLNNSTGNVYAEPSPDAIELEKFTVTGSTATGPSFVQQWNDLQNILGRRPNQDEWWNRDFIGGAPGSLRSKAEQLMHQKTPEEILEEERAKLMSMQAH